MWSPNSTDWKPINHSCDPNCWIEGLNTVAKRKIAKGEELTLDYATLCIDNEPFDCFCNSEKCRGAITGKDFKMKTLESAYGDHMSGYILTLRRQA